jgi:hypothetical protein
MRKPVNRVTFCIAGLLLWGAVMTVSAAPLTGWSCYKTVQVEGKNQYKAIWLDPDVYRYTHDLTDLRVVDAKNNFIPYFIQNGYLLEQTERQTLEARLIKRFRKKNDSYFDFQIIRKILRRDPFGDGLRMDLPSGNFYKEITVYGSYDGNTWEEAASGSIYRVDDLLRNSIPFSSQQKFGYYRIIVHNNLENIEPSGVELVAENVAWQWREYQKSVELKYKIGKKQQETWITVENSDRLQLKQLRLEVAGNFKRGFQIADNNNNLLATTNNIIFNLQFRDFKITDKTILFDEPTTLARFQVKIQNNDDQPLSVKKITADYLIDRVVFAAQGTPPYRLYFGNPRAERPRYDIREYAEHIIKEPLDSGSLTGLVRSGAAAPPGKEPDYSLIFNLVIAFVSLVMVAILARALLRNESKN